MFSLAATIVAEEAKEKFVELLLVEERSHTTSRQCFLYQLELIFERQLGHPHFWKSIFCAWFEV